MEVRLEFTQARRGLWSGATGAQFYTRDFNVVGEEAFLPKNSTGQWGLFTLQQLDFDRLKLEAGARSEHTSLSAKTLPGQPQFITGDRSFDTFSRSLGEAYRCADDWRVRVEVSRTGRSPPPEAPLDNE